MGFSSPLNITDRNTDMPFFPSSWWELFNADYGVTKLRTFNWIQAFYDSTLGVPPTICVWSNETDASGNPILSEIEFAFSGQMVPTKGLAIFLSGVDWRGNAVTSCPIGVTPTTDFTRVRVAGGMV